MGKARQAADITQGHPADISLPKVSVAFVTLNCSTCSHSPLTIEQCFESIYERYERCRAKYRHVSILLVPQISSIDLIHVQAKVQYLMMAKSVAAYGHMPALLPVRNKIDICDAIAHLALLHLPEEREAMRLTIALALEDLPVNDVADPQVWGPLLGVAISGEHVMCQESLQLQSTFHTLSELATAHPSELLTCLEDEDLCTHILDFFHQRSSILNEQF